MEYSIKQIREFANERIGRLMNDEYIVEHLPNNGDTYFEEKEAQYSAAIQNTNPDSRLFKATYEDGEIEAQYSAAIQNTNPDSRLFKASY